MNAAFLALALGGLLLFCLLKLVNGRRINLLAPVTIFNLGFFYSYFVSGFFFVYDPVNFTVYPQLFRPLDLPVEFYFDPST
jgi:hypothetical protein